MKFLGDTMQQIAFEKAGQVTFDINGTPIVVELADVETFKWDGKKGKIGF